MKISSFFKTVPLVIYFTFGLLNAGTMPGPEAALPDPVDRGLGPRTRCPGRFIRFVISSWNLDAPRGFEPRLADSESAVLPLDDGASGQSDRI